ncbi:hypothetical protein [Streptomyces sp. NBC_00872]|uniref:hypothetical protein n=1 Tax=Streptomyces sp. NBC_00872 TaxID=2903686 RepID=UPI002F90C385|nr:hypothetical protein OG214_38130 [Streptomyces sp. NBC_00872]
MGLFSRKIDRVSTEEERYRAAQAAAASTQAVADRQAELKEAKRAAIESAQARREAKTAKRARIKTVGQIKKVGRGYVTTGWEIDVPDGSGRGRVTETEVTHTGTLAGFTPAELCRIAHGPRCRRC